MNNKLLKSLGLAAAMAALVNCGSDDNNASDPTQKLFPALTESHTIEGTWILNVSGTFEDKSTYSYDTYSETYESNGDLSSQSMVIIKQKSDTEISMTFCELSDGDIYLESNPESELSESSMAEISDFIQLTFVLTNGKYTHTSSDDYYDEEPTITTLSFAGNQVSLTGSSSSEDEDSNSNAEVTAYKFSEATEFTEHNIGELVLSKLIDYNTTVIDEVAINATAHCFDFDQVTSSFTDTETDIDYSYKANGTKNFMTLSVFGTSVNGEKVEFIAEESIENYNYDEDGETGSAENVYETMGATLIDLQGDEYSSYSLNETNPRYPNYDENNLTVNYTFDKSGASGSFEGKSNYDNESTSIAGSMSIKY